MKSWTWAVVVQVGATWQPIPLIFHRCVISLQEGKILLILKAIVRLKMTQTSCLEPCPIPWQWHTDDLAVCGLCANSQILLARNAGLVSSSYLQEVGFNGHGVGMYLHRQSAPTVLGMMSYHEAVQLLQSASQEPGDHLQGLLGARGSTCPSWAPASMAHSVQTPQGTIQDISHMHPPNSTCEMMGQACFEQKVMGMGETAYMDSPFVVNSDMTNAALLGARWDLLGHPGAETYPYGGWGTINSSHSVGVVRGTGYPQGAVQNSASCALMGMLGMETN